MSARELARRSAREARAGGVSESIVDVALDPPRKVAGTPGYERLAVAMYAATLPPRERAAAVTGCAAALGLT